jgi:hypothetical protein
MVVIGVINIPAIAPTEPPRMKARRTMDRTLIPNKLAVARFSEQAFIALPKREYLKKINKKMRRMKVTPKIHNV